MVQRRGQEHVVQELRHDGLLFFGFKRVTCRAADELFELVDKSRLLLKFVALCLDPHLEQLENSANNSVNGRAPFFFGNKTNVPDSVVQLPLPQVRATHLLENFHEFVEQILRLNEVIVRDQEQVDKVSVCARVLERVHYLHVSITRTVVVGV